MKFRKLLAFILALLLIGSFTACEAGGQSETSGNDSAVELGKMSDATIWCAPASEKVLSTAKADTYAAVKTDKVKLSAAKNEYESGQIIVTAEKDVEFTVELGDLTNVADPTKKISKDNFCVYMQKYIFVARNYHNNGALTGEYPDAIIPQANAVKYGLNKVLKGRNGGAWLEYFIPSDTESGEYKGVATVKIGNESKNVDVELKVYDFALPNETTSKSLFTVNGGQVAYHELDNSLEMFDKYTDLLLKYRLSTTGVGGASQDDYVERAYEYVQKGLSTIGLATEQVLGTKNGHTMISAQSIADAIVKFAKKSMEVNVNLVEKLAYYNFYIDEPFFVTYANGMVAAQIANFDDAKVLAEAELLAEGGYDSEFGQEIIESVRRVAHIITDYYSDEMGNSHRYRQPLKNDDGTLFTYDGTSASVCAKPDGYATAEERETYKNGNELWWYNCNEPNYPYPGYHLDDTMTSAAAMSWMMAEYDIVGNLYWAVNYHMYNGENLEDAYNVAQRGSGANGEGAIVYPGKPYGVDGPVASIRLDAIRDGNEDYEIFGLLKKIYKDSGVNPSAIIRRIASEIYTNSSIYGGAEEYESARETLLKVTEAAMSPSSLKIANITEKEEDGIKSFSFEIAAADGAEVYIDNEIATAEGGIYKIEKTLEDDANYLNILAKKDGVETEFSLYLGGKQMLYRAEDLSTSDVSGDLTFGEMESGYRKLTLTGIEKSNIIITHSSINGINAKTANYIINAYNYSTEPVAYKIYVTYSGYGTVEAASGTMEPGANKIDLNFFTSVSWASRVSVSGIRITPVGLTEIGIGDIIIFGV